MLVKGFYLTHVLAWNRITITVVGISTRFNASPIYYRIYASMNQVSIDTDNGLSPIRRQAIVLTNTGLLSIGPLGTNLKFEFSFKKMHFKMLAAKWRPFCPGRWVKLQQKLGKTWRIYLYAMQKLIYFATERSTCFGLFMLYIPEECQRNPFKVYVITGKRTVCATVG